MPRFKLPEPWKIYLSVALILFLALWALLFKKRDADICREILRSAVQSKDIVLIETGQRMDSALLRAEKIFNADAFKVNFLNKELHIEMEKDGKSRVFRSPLPAGRVLILSSASASIPVVGHILKIPVGTSLITLVHSISIEEGRWDFALLMPGATVKRIWDNGEVSCPIRGNVFACGDEEWMDVKIMQLPFGGSTQSCIFAHPVNDSRLSIELHAPAKTTTLTFSGGIDDYGVHYPQGTPVEVRVLSGGRLLGGVVFENLPGFFVKDLVLSEALVRGETFSVEITSQNQDTRHFCFRAYGNE